MSNVMLDCRLLFILDFIDIFQTAKEHHIISPTRSSTSELHNKMRSVNYGLPIVKPKPEPKPKGLKRIFSRYSILQRLSSSVINAYRSIEQREVRQSFLDCLRAASLEVDFAPPLVHDLAIRSIKALSIRALIYMRITALVDFQHKPSVFSMGH